MFYFTSLRRLVATSVNHLPRKHGERLDGTMTRQVWCNYADFWEVLVEVCGASAKYLKHLGSWLMPLWYLCPGSGDVLQAKYPL